MWTKGSGMNSVNPPVRFCTSRVRTMCLAQCTGCSMLPNMIVMLERSPTEWAISWHSSHSLVVTLSGHSTSRMESSRISAAVPGSDARPASFIRRR